jgi:hypothetical protein
VLANARGKALVETDLNAYSLIKDSSKLSSAYGFTTRTKAQAYKDLTRILYAVVRAEPSTPPSNTTPSSFERLEYYPAPTYVSLPRSSADSSQSHYQTRARSVSAKIKDEYRRSEINPQHQAASNETVDLISEDSTHSEEQELRTHDTEFTYSVNAGPGKEYCHGCHMYCIKEAMIVLPCGFHAVCGDCEEGMQETGVPCSFCTKPKKGHAVCTECEESMQETGFPCTFCSIPKKGRTAKK